jgi:DNA-binding response OmpR family regulator
VRARLRTGAVPQVETLSAGELMLDLRAHSGTLRGAPLELSDTEFRILAFLMKEPGKAFTRRAIIDAIWSPRHFITERTVDVYILRLRSKIEADPENPKYLVSVRRVGYRFGPLPGVV